MYKISSNYVKVMLNAKIFLYLDTYINVIIELSE